MKLVSLDARPSVREIPLEQLPLRLGRGLHADVAIDDRWLSRCHCELDTVDGEIFVRDLNSKHGTFVNGCLVAETRLTAGDKLRIGLSEFVACVEAESAMSRPSAAD